MLTHVETRGFANEAEPVGLLTEGAAGIAVIVLAIIALAGVSPEALTSIAAIVIGVGLMVQAFNSAAEHSRMMTTDAVGTHSKEFGGDIMVDSMCGLTGIVLGILALVGMSSEHLLPPALIVFGGALLVGGAVSMRPRTTLSTSGSASEAMSVTYQGSPAASGMEILIGFAAIVLGILALLTGIWVLLLVGFLAVGAALLLASATFNGAVMRLFTA